LAGGLLAFLIVVFVYALAQDLPVMMRWLERPYLFVFPAAGALAAVALAISVRDRIDAVPFRLVAAVFAAAFGTLAISFWPYMIPFSITIAEAAAPYTSLAFMFWGAGLFVFPMMLVYTAISLHVFRGRLRSFTEGPKSRATRHIATEHRTATHTSFTQQQGIDMSKAMDEYVNV
jgi:cytochrome d ubiquinol oxidase subunit II